MNTHIHTTNVIIASALCLGTALISANAAPLGANLGGAAALHAGVPALGVGASGAASGIAVGAGSVATVPVGGWASASAGARDSTATGGAIVGPDGTLDTSAFESIGMRQARLAADASNAGGVAVSAPGMNAANAHAVTAVASAGPSVRAVERADFSARRTITAQIDDQISANTRAVATMKQHAKSLSADSKADFNAAVKDVAVREKALKRSVKVAAKASADSWGAARAKVASNYQAYMQAVARTQAISSMSSTTVSGAASAASANANGAHQVSGATAATGNASVNRTGTHAATVASAVTSTTTGNARD
ncbi:MAG TPA: hypothetical protein VHE61_02530 [Opitutaceae bacterium]|nr:hypothetical protein [Opitutaceae bacterium]